MRLCGDFSGTVNKYLEPVQSPLPSVDDTISRIGKATVFSKLDCSHAFLQLPLDDESKQFTVINTPDGLYQYSHLPYGLTASSGHFILVLTIDNDSHVRTLRQVLTTLRNAGVKLNSKKSKFFVDSVQYLGHVFDKYGVRPNPNKTKSILEAPNPKDTKQVQAFVGLCNYYSRFIPNFSHVMSPLYHLLQKNVPFAWGPSQQDSFDRIKQLFKHDNVLQHYDPNAELMLETDASPYGLGAVLMQRPDAHSSWLPVQFASRTLNSAERNYSNIEREALSIVFGLDKFRNFLLGVKFTIRNDQKPLHKLFAHDKCIPTSCSSRKQRWALKLSQYNYNFVYSQGQYNVHSDCLSRLPLPDTVEETEPYEIVCALNEVDSDFVSCHDVKLHTDCDPDLVTLKQYIRTGFPERISNANLTKFKAYVPELTITKGCIMFRHRVFIPPSLRKQVLNVLHENHPGVVSMKALARSVIWYPGMDSDIESLVLNCKQCQSIRTKPAKANVQWPLPSRPWGRIHIDHFFFENQTCLLIIDAFSKYVEVECVKSTSVSETIDALSVVFARHGLPDVLVSDNASCFTAFEFKGFLSRNGVKHMTPPPYSPASNGQAERGVRMVKDALKKCSFKGSLRYRLSKILLEYRCTPHSTTQIAPAVSLNNRKLITLKDIINPQFCSFETQSKTKLLQFELGSSVLVLNMREGQRWLHGTVIKQYGINTYDVFIPELNATWTRHANQLVKIPKLPDCTAGANVTPPRPVVSPVLSPKRNRQPPDRLMYS